MENIKTVLPWVNWVARDLDGTLTAFRKKPVRTHDSWVAKVPSILTHVEGDYYFETLRTSIFPDINWSDAEPTNVKDYIEKADCVEIPVDVNWVARDEDGKLNGYPAKPFKMGAKWDTGPLASVKLKATELPDWIFPFVKWSDFMPMKLDRLEPWPAQAMRIKTDTTLADIFKTLEVHKGPEFDKPPLPFMLSDNLKDVDADIVEALEVHGGPVFPGDLLDLVDEEVFDPIEPNYYRKGGDGKVDLYESWYLTRPFNEFRAIMESIAERYLKRVKEDRLQDLDKMIYTVKRLREYEVRELAKHAKVVE